MAFSEVTRSLLVRWASVWKASETILVSSCNLASLMNISWGSICFTAFGSMRQREWEAGSYSFTFSNRQFFKNVLFLSVSMELLRSTKKESFCSER